MASRHLPAKDANYELTGWLEWAKAKADWYDPFVEHPIELLDAIDRETLAIPKT